VCLLTKLNNRCKLTEGFAPEAFLLPCGTNLGVEVSDLPPRMWSTEQTAEVLQVPVSTMYQLNHKNTGPRFFKVGRHCRYDPRDVMAWLESCASRPAAVAVSA
jgi:excisionase family DNA binding protein